MRTRNEPPHLRVDDIFLNEYRFYFNDLINIRIRPRYVYIKENTEKHKKN